MLITWRHWVCRPNELIEHALSTAWILDIDTTVKTLSDIKVAPRPVTTRISRDAPAAQYTPIGLATGARAAIHVQSGKSHSAASSLPGLIEVIGRLPKEQRPQLVRVNCGFSNEVVIRELEGIEQPCLFKLKQTSNVKRLIERQWRRHDWCDVGQGWQACDGSLTLTDSGLRHATSSRARSMSFLVAGPDSVPCSTSISASKSTSAAV